MAAIVSRLFLVLTVGFFGAYHVGAERTATHNGHVAVPETAIAPFILTAQTHLIRESMPEGDTPQATAPRSETPKPRQTLASVPRQPFATVPTSVINVLPPVRGPPAV
ncbi:MAG: hypothetical protein CMN10_08030 [Roseobacter sp.]|nr:hypothetical protein [Roseobacter sp.]MBV48496.1 hypothetical protein [Roseobacter sp.]